MRIPILVGLSALFLSSAGFEAGAAEKMYGPGVTDTEIKIGQTVPYSGPASAFSSYGRVMIGYFQDPARAQDPEVIEYIAFMKKWAPNDSPNDFIALSGYVNAQAIARGLQRCGDNLTRENLLAQATSFNKERVGHAASRD